MSKKKVEAITPRKPDDSDRSRKAVWTAIAFWGPLTQKELITKTGYRRSAVAASIKWLGRRKLILLIDGGRWDLPASSLLAPPFWDDSEASTDAAVPAYKAKAVG